MLIMAYNQFEIFEKLMKMLDHERNDLYIHVDKKARGFPQKYFENICKKSRVIFIPRKKVYWGHSVLVDCEIRSMEAALTSEEDYSYFHVLSGIDLQIKKTEEIHKFFAENPNKQYLAFRNTISGLGGLNRYYFFLLLRAYNRYLAKGLDIISQFI